MRSGCTCLFVLLLTGSCNRQSPLPSDFNFLLHFSSVNTVNTRDSTLTKAYVFKDSVIKFTFSRDEMVRIHATMIDNDYASLPTRFTLDHNSSCVVPAPIDFIKITINDSTKTIMELSMR